jgi:hypothetical protein
MRIVLFVFGLLIASRSAHAATAYEALRVLGKQRSEATLDSTVEVHGEKGRSQPAVWKIIVKDPAARGGYSEYSVQGTRLGGEQTPGSSPSGATLNMSQLNLDSDGVHQIAEREAKKAPFGYDYANYRLRAGSRGGSPVWEIQLVDDRSGAVATMTVAATTGNVLSKEGFTSRSTITKATPAPAPAPAPASQSRPARVAQPPEAIAESPYPSGRGGMQDAGDQLNQFVGRVGNHMDRRGQQVGDFFYNLFHKDKRNTVGPQGSEPVRTTPPPPSATRDTNAATPSRIRD